MSVPEDASRRENTDRRAHDHAHRRHHEHGHDNHLDPISARVRALETLLVAKGLVDPAAIDAIVDTYEHRIGPRNGARVVARAWCDEEFRAWLERDATAAIASLGFTGRQGEHMRAVFNTPDVHNVVVCTLCSCYPWSVLGLPPTWYKSPAYRARVVVEPRAVLAEFGVVLPEGVSVRVRDSTAELRWLVVPERPPGTDGMDEAALAALVTRDAMIGTGLVPSPIGRAANETTDESVDRTADETVDRTADGTADGTPTASSKPA